MDTPKAPTRKRAALLFAVLLAVSSWATVSWQTLAQRELGLRRAWAGTKPGVTFGSGGGLGLLRHLLNAPLSKGRLKKLSRHMAVWSIALERVPEESSSVCHDPATGTTLDHERVRVAFLFGSHSRRSQRVYRVRYATCQDGVGTTTIAPESEGFAAEFGLDSTPMLADPDGLRVLTAALNDDAVFEELRRLEESSPVSYLRVTKVGIDEDLVGEYDLVAADSSPREWSGETRKVQIKAFVDLEQGSTTFHNRLD
jgi:hypothetical protein